MQHIVRKRLLKNIISLIILQGSNYIFPLITFPYLVRILDAGNYGILVFCVALMQFLNIFVDYGFNMSATREIAINKTSPNKVNAIYNIVMTIKTLLTITTGILYLVIIIFVPNSDGHLIAFLISFLIIVGNTLFPIWLYQGLEKMKYITILNIISKVIVTVLIFTLIKEKEDINLAVFFQTLYYVLPGLISVFVVKNKFNITFRFVFDFQIIREELKKGVHFFTTNLWINFYSQGPLIILGFISGNVATGNYGIGQKIMGAFYGLAQPIIQAIYPFICDLYENNRKKFLKFRKNMLYLSLLVSLLISTSLYLFSNEVTKIVSGSPNTEISTLVRIFSIIILLSITNTVTARIMYAMSMQKHLSKIYLIAAFTFIALSFPLTILFQESGMAISVILSELVIFIFSFKSVLLHTPCEEVSKKIS
ncbi:flippase [Priestia endophytica]|uniref:flippase n=1 Tax=Priestia endophytica TaxID=135735 RepID=UPI003D2A606C